MPPTEVSFLVGTGQHVLERMPVHAKATAEQTAMSRCRIRVPAARIADIALVPHCLEWIQTIRLGETLTGPLEDLGTDRNCSRGGGVQAIEGALMTRCAIAR